MSLAATAMTNGSTAMFQARGRVEGIVAPGLQTANDSRRAATSCFDDLDAHHPD